MVRTIRIFAVCALAAAVGIVPVAPAQAGIPTTPCASFTTQHVAGGLNAIPSNPGNINSKLWIRAQGVSLRFRVPITATVRHDCVGAAGGILAKIRTVDANDELTDGAMIAGVLFENTSDPVTGQFLFGATSFGYAYYSSSPPNINNAWVSLSDNSILSSACHLHPGLEVKIRVRNGRDQNNQNIWVPECWNWEASPQRWENMILGCNCGGILANRFDGVGLGDRWRAGAVGGLNLDATELKYKDLGGSWGSWNANSCWSNNTTGDTYRYASVSDTHFTVAAGAANPNC